MLNGVETTWRCNKNINKADCVRVKVHRRFTEVEPVFLVKYSNAGFQFMLFV